MAPLPIWIAQLDPTQRDQFRKAESVLNEHLGENHAALRRIHGAVDIWVYKISEEIGADLSDPENPVIRALIDSYRHAGWRVQLTPAYRLIFSWPK